MKPTLPNYLQARLKIARQEWGEAIRLLESVRKELGPGAAWSSRVHVLLGLCYRQTGDHEQEMQAFRRAVAEEPTWLAASVGLGAALLSVGRVEEASELLEPLRSASNVPPSYWVLLSRCRLAREMRLPEAERHFKEVEEALTVAAKESPKSAEVAIARANLLAAQGEFAAAKSLLESTRTEHPDDLAVWCARAELAARQERFADAEAILDQAERTPQIGDRVELRLALCRLWSQRGNAEDRVKLARLADSLPASYTDLEHARLQHELADTWFRLNEGNRAEVLWRVIARALPKDLRSRTRLFEVALEKQQPKTAYAWLDEIRGIEGDRGALSRWGEIALQIQEAHGRKSQLAEARKKLHELEKQHKQWPRVPFLAATLFELEGHYQQAIQEYLRALELGDVPPRGMARLLTLLVERRELAKAETALAKYEQKTPLTRELARLGADIALGMRDARFAKLAVQRAEQAVALPARDYRDLLWLARVQQGVGNETQAEKHLRDALEQAPHAPDIWIAWMEHLARAKQFALAETELQRMTSSVSVGRRLLTLARCYEALRQLERAAATYETALLEGGSDDFITLAHAADFYRRADQPAKAKPLYERLLDPTRIAAPAEYAVPARRHLAVLLAPSDRKKALELLDDNKNTRGPTLADERVRYYAQSLASPTARQDALARFQHSLRLELPTPDERVLLARILEASVQLTHARVQLMEAVDESPTPPYLGPLVRILIATYDLDEADRQFERLQALESTGDRVRNLRAMLTRAHKKTADKAP